MNRQQIKSDARDVIDTCASNEPAIRAGLRIAACGAMGRRVATAEGCRKAADDISAALVPLFMHSTTLAHRLARLVSRRDWPSLWMAARREVYPSTCA